MLDVTISNTSRDIIIEFSTQVSSVTMPIDEAMQLAKAIIQKIVDAQTMAAQEAADWLNVPLTINNTSALKAIILARTTTDMENIRREIAHQMKDPSMLDRISNRDDPTINNFLNWVQSLPNVPPRQ